MKPSLPACLGCALLFFLVATGTMVAQDAPFPFKGYFKTIPLHGATTEKALSDSLAGTTVPLWSWVDKSSRDGNKKYSTILMGRYPDSLNLSDQTTNISTLVVPLVVTMPDSGDIFDPTTNTIDPNCNVLGKPLGLTQKSPLFNDAPFTWGNTDVGTTQYIDAFQRAEFWNQIGIILCSTSFGGIGGSRYSGLGTPDGCIRGGTLKWHTRFTPTTSATQYYYPVNGLTYYYGTCGEVGIIDMTELQAYVETNLIPSLGISPTTFVVVLMENVVQAENDFQTCCVLGFHGAYAASQGTQFYGTGEWDTTGLFGKAAQDVSILSHELGEAVNDPTGNDPAPSWGNVGQVTGCQTNFEVGDPLTGTLMPPLTLNGFTYNLQELAFYSWFFGAPGYGVNGWFSSNNTFKTDAGLKC